MFVTLAIVSTLTRRRRIEARIRRTTSLLLSALCGVIIVANLILFVQRPSAFLTDGTFGLAPLHAVVVHALWWTPVVAIAAVLVVGTMPAAASASPPVDRLPNRFPMTAAVITLCLACICIATPLIIFLASFLFVVLAAVL